MSWLSTTLLLPVLQGTTPFDWLDFILKVGVPTAALGGLAYFTVTRIWPFLVKQVEETNNERKSERREFMNALERRDSEFEKVVKALESLSLVVRDFQERDELQVKWQDKVDKTLEGIANDIRNIKGAQSRRQHQE